jgi:hypothetical protein
MSTSALFEQYFGDTYAVGLKHPNMEAFFEALKQEITEEDRRKQEALLCCVCKKNYVDSHAGYDTCDSCLVKL